MDESIGYLGPGVMGRAIVKRLLSAGIQVTVFVHRADLDLEDLRRSGALVTDSLRTLAEKNRMIMLTLPSSREVERAILGPSGLLDCLREGSVVIDLSTSLPSSTRMLAARLRERGIDMLDAPMAGGARQAAAGELTLVVGGEKGVYERCLPVLRAIAKNVFFVGGTGHGHTVKLINNFFALLNNAAIAEVLPLAVKCGIDIRAMSDVIRVSWGNSRVFELIVPAICRRDFTVTFPLKLCHKDVSYMSALGREQGVPLPMVNSTLQVFDLATACGLGEENSNALVKLWERISQVEVHAKMDGGST
jgi:3-hydroxyisobutyrate dehydrogenase-like beta-hydroxyacid dehydrogenase